LHRCRFAVARPDVSAKGTQIEGNVITPDIPIAWFFEEVAAGHRSTTV
jgi:hypothetical protein